MNREPAASPLGRALLALAGLAVLAVAAWVVSVAAAHRAPPGEEPDGGEPGASEARSGSGRIGSRGRRSSWRPRDEESAGEAARERESSGAGEGLAREGEAVTDPSTPGDGGDDGASLGGRGAAGVGAGWAPGIAGSAGSSAGSGEGNISVAPGTGGLAPGGLVLPGGIAAQNAAAAAAAAAIGSAAGSDPYQGRSGALASNTTPLSTLPLTQRSAAGAPYLASTFPSGKIQAGQEIAIGATLADASLSLVTPSIIEISVTRLSEPAPDAYVPMGPPDPGANGQFVYRTTAPSDTPAPGAGPLLMHFFIRASGEIEGAPFDRGVAGTFLVHSPGAKFDPASAQIAHVGPDAVLALQLQVQRAGTFIASAELWGGADGTRPVAFARERVDAASVGAQTVAMIFAGPVIRASNVDGPYHARNVQLSRVDTSPPHEQDPIAELTTTPPWRHGDF